MRTFQEFLAKEGWFGNMATDVYDSVAGPSTASYYLKKMFKRIHDDDDTGSWRGVVDGLMKYGRQDEAKALEVALKAYIVKVSPGDYDPRIGFHPDSVTVEFYPKCGNKSELCTKFRGSNEVYKQYNRYWANYGSPIQVVGENEYWDVVDEKIQKFRSKIYGFVVNFRSVAKDNK